MKNIVEFLKNTGMNEYAIKLKENKQPPFDPIYNLEQVELEILKIYIKTNLANSFIQLFKSYPRAPILFYKKPNRSLCLYVNYRNLNNIIIKN